MIEKMKLLLAACVVTASVSAAPLCDYAERTAGNIRLRCLAVTVEQMEEVAQLTGIPLPPNAEDSLQIVLWTSDEKTEGFLVTVKYSVGEETRMATLIGDRWRYPWMTANGGLVFRLGRLAEIKILSLRVQELHVSRDEVIE